MFIETSAKAGFNVKVGDRVREASVPSDSSLSRLCFASSLLRCHQPMLRSRRKKV